MSSIYQRDGVWQYQVQRPGKPPLRRSLRTRSKVEARLRQRAIDAKLSKGEPVDEREAAAARLSAWTDPYADWAANHIGEGTLSEKLRYIKEWIAVTGKDDISSIEMSDIEKYKNTSLKSNIPATVNLKFTHLASYVERCRRLGLHDEKNPFSLKLRERLPVSRKHKEWLSNPEDIRALLDVARKMDRDLYVFILLGIFAGLRKGEIDAALWEWINWDTAPPLLQVTNSAQFRLKDKTDRTIPICDDLRVALEPIRMESGFIIAPEDTDKKADGYRRDFSYLLRSAAAHAGLKIRLTPHILRHTFASRLASKGVSLLVIAKYMGHEDPKLTYQTYSHLSPTSESINKLNLGE